MKDQFRPAHADYTYRQKYGVRDYRGGGRSSARETAGRVAAGSIAKKYLKMVGLGDRMKHTSNQISGGQQQRVAIARSLVMNPALIMADEPTGNIATSQAEEIMEIFQNLNDEGRTIVMITHEADIAEHAKRIILIRDGKIVSDKKNNQKRIKPLIKNRNI